ncbi:hypothetical protein U1Q18_010069, partial [Sarracenia purpurea var. burkii]
VIEWLAWYMGSPSTEELRREIDFSSPVKGVLREEVNPKLKDPRIDAPSSISPSHSGGPKMIDEAKLAVDEEAGVRREPSSANPTGFGKFGAGEEADGTRTVIEDESAGVSVKVESEKSCDTREETKTDSDEYGKDSEEENTEPDDLLVCEENLDDRETEEGMTRKESAPDVIVAISGEEQVVGETDPNGEGGSVKDKGVEEGDDAGFEVSILDEAESHPLVSVQGRVTIKVVDAMVIEGLHVGRSEEEISPEDKVKFSSPLLLSRNCSVVEDPKGIVASVHKEKQAGKMSGGFCCASQMFDKMPTLGILAITVKRNIVNEGELYQACQVFDKKPEGPVEAETEKISVAPNQVELVMSGVAVDKQGLSLRVWTP